MTVKNQEVERTTRRKVKPDDVTTDTDTFQFRLDGLTNYHVEALKDTLRRGIALDPIEVWLNPKGGKLVVIDGHHRLEAHRAVRGKQPINVIVHRCSRKQARLLAIQANSKARLAMSNDERLNAAWALDAEGGYSKAELVKYTGVGDGTIAKMRRHADQIRKMEQSLPSTWKEAMRIVSQWEPNEMSEDEREAMKEEKVTKLIEKVGSDLAFMINHDVEVFAEVIDRIAGHKLKYVVEHWGGYLDDGEPAY